jgi:hypothetical protein
MTFTINLKPELESRLRGEAARNGVDPDTYLVQTLEERLGKGPPDQPRLPAAESELLLKINSGPPGLDWDRYHALLARNRDEMITLAEHKELIAMIHTVEKANAERIVHLVELSRLRGVSLDSLMKSLDISPPPVE